MKIDWNIYTFLIILVNQRGKFLQFSKKINILRFCLAFAQVEVTLYLLGYNQDDKNLEDIRGYN